MNLIIYKYPARKCKNPTKHVLYDELLFRVVRLEDDGNDKKFKLLEERFDLSKDDVDEPLIGLSSITFQQNKSYKKN